MSDTSARVDRILSNLNAADIGSLDSVAGKLALVQEELEQLGQAELAARAAEAIAALRRGEVAEFQRGRAFLQAKVGHLR